MPSYFVRDVASSSSFYPPVSHTQTNKFNGLIDSHDFSGGLGVGLGGGGGGGGGGSGSGVGGTDVRCVSQLQLRKQHDTLNVNGRKFFRNKDKTIWSYNPDDFLIRVSGVFKF